VQLVFPVFTRLFNQLHRLRSDETDSTNRRCFNACFFAYLWMGIHVEWCSFKSRWQLSWRCRLEGQTFRRALPPYKRQRSNFL